MPKDETNGAKVFQCPFVAEWAKNKKEAEELMHKINGTHSMVTDLYTDMHTNGSHLADISQTLKDMKGGLIESMLGKNITPMGVTEKLLAAQQASHDAEAKAQRRAYMSIIWVLTSIVVVVIGLKYVAPSVFGG